MWKKVLYFGVAIIFGILIYIIGYSSNQMNHLEGIVNRAIEKEEFYKVPMVWDGCFDTKSIIENNGEKLDIVMYPATSQTDVSFGEEENKSRFLNYERSYYLYVFNTKFSISTINAGSTSYNKTSISFSNENGSYEYYFIVNDSMNSQSYVENPMTKEQVLLNTSRDVTNTNSTWNFMRITFTETMLEQIKKEIGGDITKLELKDADGNVQYSSEVKLDFSQSFFTDVKDLFDNYNVYLNSYMDANQGKDKDKVKEAENKFQEFYKPWYENFENTKEQTGYTFRYDDSYLSPGKLVWQTVGMLALYALVVALFYILLFHFSAVKRIFSRENYKDYSKKSTVMVNGKMVERSKVKSAKPSSTKPQIEVNPDTIADETLETVTAGEVLEAASTNDITEDLPKEQEIKTEELVVPSAEVVEESEPTTETIQEEVPLMAEPQEEKPVEVKKEASKKAPVKKAPAKKTTSTKSAPKKTTGSKTTSTKKTSSSTQKKTVEPKENKNAES